jgi:aminoglycoside phosphotransferase (APT) family kinase protein
VPQRPPADIAITEALVRTLLAAHAHSGVRALAERPIVRAASGWDCEMWRLGDDLCARLPRRASAAALIEHEQSALPAIRARIAATGIRVPAPVAAGGPTDAFPWPWSVVPWIPGTTGLESARSARTPWAAQLAAVLSALHVVADDPWPANPYRGVPLAQRGDVTRARIRGLQDRGLLSPGDASRLATVWWRGAGAPPWARRPVWIHGDLHPGNLIVRDERLRAVIDFGDVTAGDPAYDLAAAWIVFDARGRAAFMDAYRADAATWTRAKGWAAAVGALLLEHGDGDAAHANLGREIVAEVGAYDETPV